jgi:hypothetical protein
VAGKHLKKTKDKIQDQMPKNAKNFVKWKVSTVNFSSGVLLGGEFNVNDLFVSDGRWPSLGE